MNVLNLQVQVKYKLHVQSSTPKNVLTVEDIKKLTFHNMAPFIADYGCNRFKKQC